MEAQQFVNLAISKDITRLNLKHVYRAKNALVATDGCRLHKRFNLPDMPPHYPDGFDGEFPDYAQVEPSHAPVTIIRLELFQAKTLKSKLKIIRDIAKLGSKDIKAEFSANVGKPGLTITAKALDISASIHLEAEIAHSTVTNIRVGLNMNYVLDALAPAFDVYTEHAIIRLYDTPTERFPYSLAPVTICFESAENCNLSALIMPVRLE